MGRVVEETQDSPFRIESIEELHRNKSTVSHPRKRRRRRRSYYCPTFSCLLFAVAFLNLESLHFIDYTNAYSSKFSFLSRRKLDSSTFQRSRGRRIQPKTQVLMAQNLATDGLSPYFQGMLSRINDRQRFVTGKYPLIVSVQENPTRKWLNLGRTGETTSNSMLLVNDTTIDRSLASYDRFQWLDEEERKEVHKRYTSVSLELLAEINTGKPGYLHILPSDGAGVSAAALRKVEATTTRWNRWRNSALYEELEDIEWNGPYRDRLWVTGFTLAGRKGIVSSVDVNNGHIDSVNSRSEAMTLWPNEVNSVPRTLVTSHLKKASIVPNVEQYDDALLVSDGFLVPGKDRGGIYVIRNPSNPNSEWTTCLTNTQGDRWFYHRAVWVDLTGDGRKSILTARAKLRKVRGKDPSSLEKESRPKNGQLVWLEMPKPHHFDEATGTPLEEDGTTFDPFSARHLPWKERVLATGPDVMFNVADMDETDETIEVIASQFFDKKVTLHSIQIGERPYVSFSRVIDDRCGASFGGILASLDSKRNTRHVVVDSGSTVVSLKPGDTFSHVLVTSHECDYVETDRSESNAIDDSSHQSLHGKGVTQTLDGGSLFAYKVPEGVDAWKTDNWTRTTVATGFKVKAQLWNVINPGAPGFCYTFHAKKDDVGTGKRPMIAVAGDCAESAFIFRPEQVGVDHASSVPDPTAQYKLMCEIKCGATVGSIGIGYDDLCSATQERGYAKIYVPCFEKDKILVFAMGSGEEEEDDDGW